MQETKSLITEKSERNTLIPQEGLIQKPNESFGTTCQGTMGSGLGHGNVLNILNGAISNINQRRIPLFRAGAQSPVSVANNEAVQRLYDMRQRHWGGAIQRIWAIYKDISKGK